MTPGHRVRCDREASASTSGQRPGCPVARPPAGTRGPGPLGIAGPPAVLERPPRRRARARPPALPGVHLLPSDSDPELGPDSGAVCPWGRGCVYWQGGLGALGPGPDPALNLRGRWHPRGPVPAQPGSAGGPARPWLPVTQWLGWSSAVPRCFGWMQT